MPRLVRVPSPRRAGADARPPGRRPSGARRSRRLVPLAVLAAAAFAAGVVQGARHGVDAERIAERYASAWGRGDHAAMHALLTPAAREETPLAPFVRAHRRAAATATLWRLTPRRAATVGDGVARIPVLLETRVFGVLRQTVRLPVGGDGEDAGIDWAPHHAFPGLRKGERLGRRTSLPPRADLLSADGTPLARGPDRTSTAGPSLAGAIGTLGPVSPERRAELAGVGVPADARVGVSGLERWLDARLRGRAGGELRAGARVLARTRPIPAADVRSSLDLDLQEAAQRALAGRLGGVVALRPATGEVLALTGLATSAPQPPGSTFKVITLAGALEAGVVRRGEEFPVQTSATLEGVELQNANGEACGGTLRESFAESCNSVFGPLGARLGARRLVAAAERFGFNEPPPLPGAAPSTLPPAGEIGDDLAVGSTAIGQGRVLATTLQMAWVAATIANRGTRVGITALAGDRGREQRAVPADVARFVNRAMRAVVTSGTGVSAAIEGVSVAGKTGTAELRTTQPPVPPDPLAPGLDPAPPPEDTTDTDAWFTAFAPASRPRIAVAVLLVGQGAGGETAAPAARTVLAAALGRD